MEHRTHVVNSLDELREYVHATLCAKENLVAEQFRMAEETLVSRDRLCGIQFSLRGLRSVRLGAIWTADQNCIYFYDARGDRYLKVKLTERFEITSRQSA